MHQEAEHHPDVSCISWQHAPLGSLGPSIEFVDPKLSFGASSFNRPGPRFPETKASHACKLMPHPAPRLFAAHPKFNSLCPYLMHMLHLPSTSRQAMPEIFRPNLHSLLNCPSPLSACSPGPAKSSSSWHSASHVLGATFKVQAAREGSLRTEFAIYSASTVFDTTPFGLGEGKWDRHLG